MLIRIVRMTIREDRTENFLALFEASSQDIRKFKGCSYLELMRDYHKPNVFVSYTHWATEAELDEYRHSQTFISIWAKIKILFSDRAVVYSLKSEKVYQ